LAEKVLQILESFDAEKFRETSKRFVEKFDWEKFHERTKISSTVT